MSLTEVERFAMELTETERARLALTLLESVAPDSLQHREDELEQRERELENGTVSEIGYEELLRRVAAERRR